MFLINLYSPNVFLSVFIHSRLMFFLPSFAEMHLASIRSSRNPSPRQSPLLEEAKKKRRFEKYRLRTRRKTERIPPPPPHPPTHSPTHPKKKMSAVKTWLHCFTFDIYPASSTGQNAATKKKKERKRERCVPLRRSQVRLMVLLGSNAFFF